MKKVISFVLTLAMMLGAVLIPSTALVCASTPLPGFQISGAEVKLSGTELVKYSGGTSVVKSGHIYYDATKNEITLDNVQISCEIADGIYYNGTTDPLVINLVGNNIVTSSKYAIFGKTSVIITGSGVLRAEAGEECVALGSKETFTIGGGAQVNLYATYTSGRAISAAAIEIRDSEVTATAYWSTIYASEELTITDGAVVKSIAQHAKHGYALFARENIRICGSSVEAISSNIVALYANGNIAINNSSLSALATTSYSIYTPSGNIVITNSAVDCIAKIGTICNNAI